jgi:hypothetical protein
MLPPEFRIEARHVSDLPSFVTNSHPSNAEHALGVVISFRNVRVPRVGRLGRQET